MTIKERIKDLCRQKGISMNQLEQDLGFGVGYISKLGKSTPNTKKLQQIADYFNVTLDYLMTGKEPEFSSETDFIVDYMNDDNLKEIIKCYQSLPNEKKELITRIVSSLCKIVEV